MYPPFPSSTSTSVPDKQRIPGSDPGQPSLAPGPSIRGGTFLTRPPTMKNGQRPARTSISSSVWTCGARTRRAATMTIA